MDGQITAKDAKTAKMEPSMTNQNADAEGVCEPQMNTDEHGSYGSDGAGLRMQILARLAFLAVHGFVYPFGDILSLRRHILLSFACT
jgi:hypothetical protein